MYFSVSDSRTVQKNRSRTNTYIHAIALRHKRVSTGIPEDGNKIKGIRDERVLVYSILKTRLRL